MYHIIHFNSYTYYVDNVSEGFSRKLANGATTTHNEFFGRKDTVKELPQLPQVYKWTKSVGKGELFDDSYIPTVHITGDKSNKMFTEQKTSSDYLENITFILKDSIYTFKKIPAYPKNKGWNKFQFRVNLNNDGIEGRYTLKFRDNNEDPTFLRQGLYGDIMNALGNPTIQSINTRVYVNEKAVGYYVLQEEAASESFVRSAFHGDGNGKYLITDINELGHSFDCSTGADFYYTNNTFTSFKPYNSERYGRVRVQELCKQFEALDASNSSQIKTFEQKYFDIDTFFRAIAMQILTGHWDSYWLYSTNFAVYSNTAENNKFYFICQDWDGTFGLNIAMPYMRYENFIDRSYKDFVNIEWGLDQYDSPYRYAIDKLLSNKSLRTRFEDILKTIVVKILNPKVINKRIDALVARHRDEIAWNYETISKYPLRKGTSSQLNWTMDDFDTNINTISRYGASYGLKEWIYRRAKAIKEEFKLNIDLGTETYGSDISRNGLCGPENGKCPSGQCCSKYGFCGTDSAHCDNCQPEFGYCPNSTTTTTTIKKTTTTTTVKKTTTTTVKKTTTTTKKAAAATTKKAATTTTKKAATTTTKKAATTTTKKAATTTTKKAATTTTKKAATTTTKKAATTTTKKAATTTTKKAATTTTKKAATTTTKKAASTTTKKAATTKASTPTSDIKISTDGTCGVDKGRCPEGLCCSKYGYCGVTSSHCENGCQSEFGICNSAKPTTPETTDYTKVYSADNTCGEGKGRCPDGLCCSQYGYCGSTTAHCTNKCQPKYGICN